jgi:hypothetical protein
MPLGSPSGIPTPSGRAGTATAEVAGVSAAEVREARKVMARIERQLSRLSERETRLHDDMVVAATDPTRLAELNAALQGLVDEREELELDWLAAAEKSE